MITSNILEKSLFFLDFQRKVTDGGEESGNLLLHRLGVTGVYDHTLSTPRLTSESQRSPCLCHSNNAGTRMRQQALIKPRA